MCKDLGWKLQGEVWGDANAALGIINRSGLGKTRHIDTGLLWIQQVAAERKVKFQRVLGTNNPADLFTNHLDEKTNLHHTNNLGFQCTAGRPEDAPKLHALSTSIYEYCDAGNQRVWPWLQYLSSGKDKSEKQRIHNDSNGDVNMLSEHDRSVIPITTQRNVWQQVLWGYKWRACPDHPWGSTLTSQCIPKRVIGVPCGIGLTHGVTMHPRGRHLREGMVLLRHGLTHSTEREQHEPSQPHKYLHNHLHNHIHNYHYNWWRPWYGERGREDGTRPGNKRRDIASRRRYRDYVPPAKPQSGEFYRNVEHTNLVNSDQKLGRRKICNETFDSRLGPQEGHRATWCRRVT